MKEFISGRTNKVVAIFLLMLLPRLITSIIFDYDYGLGAIIGTVLTILFMMKFDKTAIIKIKNNSKKLKLSNVFLLFIMMFSFQFIFLFLSAKTGNLSINTEWLTYANIVSPIIIAPIAEEITFRWALIETCLDENTKKFSKISYVLIFLLIWNFIHTKSLTSINIPVIILGLLLYLINFKSGNILYCIITHMFANFFVVVLSSPLQNVITALCDSNIILIIDIAILILSSFTVFRNLRLKTSEK